MSRSAMWAADNRGSSAAWRRKIGGHIESIGVARSRAGAPYANTCGRRTFLRTLPRRRGFSCARIAKKNGGAQRGGGGEAAKAKYRQQKSAMKISAKMKSAKIVKRQLGVSRRKAASVCENQ